MKKVVALLVSLACSFAGAVADTQCVSAVLSAATSANRVDIPLGPGEKAAAYIALTGRPNEVALSTTGDRIVFFDLSTGTISNEIAVSRPGALKFFPTNTWFSSSSGLYGASYLINRTNNEVFPIVHPTGMANFPNVVPAGISLHPTKAQALSYAGIGSYLVVEMDLTAREMRPMFTAKGQTMVGLAATAAYLNNGKDTVITINSGEIEDQKSSGFVIGSNGDTQAFQLPEMHFMNGSPAVHVAPEGRTFATVTVEGPAYHVKGQRKAWVHVFSPQERETNGGEPELIKPTLRFLVKGPQSGLFMDRPYLPPTAFTRDGKVLIGNVFGTVDLYNMQAPVKLDDYQTGEHLTSFDDGHNKKPVTALAVSSRFYASGAEDGTVTLWSVDRSTKHTQVADFPERITSLEFVTINGEEKLLVQSKAKDTTVGDTEPSQFFLVALP